MHAILLRQAQTQSFMHFLHSRTRAHGVLSIRKGGPTVIHAYNAFHKSARNRTYLADKRLSSVSTRDRRNHKDDIISGPFLFSCHSFVRCTGIRDLLDLIVGMQQLNMFLNDRRRINIRSEKEEYVSSAVLSNSRRPIPSRLPSDRTVRTQAAWKALQLPFGGSLVLLRALPPVSGRIDSAMDPHDEAIMRDYSFHSKRCLPFRKWPS
jgi:hypothetical protein